MLAKQRRAAPAATVRSHVERVEMDQFARRLHAAMTAKGFNNSDLARAVWGETEDAKGYKVARNRDRIGVYLKGTQFPEPATLAKIAEALGTTAEELAPEITAAAVDRERPELSISMVSGHPDKVHVQVNALLPLSAAVEISRIIERVKRGVTLVPGIDTDDAV